MSFGKERETVSMWKAGAGNSVRGSRVRGQEGVMHTNQVGGPHRYGPPRRKPADPGLFSLRASLGLVVVLGLAACGSVGYAAAYVLLMIWSLRGRRESLEALCFCWLITYLNPGLFARSGSAEILRWGVILLSGVTITFVGVRRQARLPRIVTALLVLCLVNALLIVVSSYAPDVSAFKLASFLFTVGAVLYGFEQESTMRERWSAFFFSFFGGIVLVSAPLRVVGPGFLKNGMGFQGILDHPQAFGIFVCSFLPWALCVALERRGRSVIPWGIVALAAGLLIESQSRTGLMGTVLGSSVALVWYMLRGGRDARIANRVMVVGGATAALLLCVAFVRPDVFRRFLQKNSGQTDLAASFYESRGYLLERSMANFYRAPLAGIGFGLASVPEELNVSRDPVFHLPLGAPVEKGIVFVAVLEESGVLGMAAFVAFIAVLLRGVATTRVGPAPLALALGALSVNIGESVFFAVGGSGLILWVLVGAARTMAAGARS